MPKAAAPLEAFTAIKAKGHDRYFLHRIGVAFPNDDGTIGVVLNSLPLDGRIILRPAGTTAPQRPPTASKPGP